MKKLLLSFLCCMLAVIGMQAEEVTFTVGEDIKSTSAELLDGKLTLSTAKNNGTSNPAYNTNLRFYYDNTGNGNGCSATLTTDGTIKITSVELTAASGYTPTVKYKVDGGDLATGTWNNTTMTISGIEAKTSFMFQNANTENKQLRITSITITYESTLDGSTPFLKADVTELAFRTKPGEISEAKIVTLTTANLKNLAYQLNESSFAVLDNGNYTYSVTFTAPAEECTKNGTLVFSADDVEPVTISLLGVSSNTTLDVLNREFTGITGTTYSDWDNKTATSGAVYAGNSAGGNDAIQLRSSDNAGIVTKISGGKAKSIIVSWNTSTANDRTLEVYGKNTAYTGVSDLYGDNKGTPLGEIAKGSTTNLVIDGDYEYIGLRSKSGAMYLDEIQIEWAHNSENPIEPTPDPEDQLAAPTFSPAGGAVEAGTEVTITATNDATIMYKVGDGEYAEYSAPIVINEECTITAYATKDGFTDSEVVTATYTIEQPFEPTVFGNVVDVLNFDFTGMSGTTYDNWADKVGVSGTKYLGNSAAGNNAIQLRSNNSNSGIVSDRSVGTVKKVTVTWNTNTAEGRTLDVYGSNTAYISASNLYDTKTQGTKLGSIVYGTSTELVIEGEYEYIGLRSKSGAMYLEEIQIEWYIPYPETITAGMYYLVPGEWENEELALYGIKFINVNTGESEWVQGFLNNHYVYFQLDGEGKYTHMAFYRIKNTGNTTTTEITDWDAIEVLDKTPELTYTAPGAGNLMRYNVDESKWEEVEIGTGLNRVELADGIGYAYGVVSAEGAIEVYNVNGAVVARGNDNVDLRGLGRGVYIIRNGNQVRKVVR